MNTAIKQVNKPKRVYASPHLQFQFIHNEHSIAAGSANVTVGNQNNQYTPDVDEWNEAGTRTSDFDI
ncbi:hypothetical protein M8998_04095 [Sphingobacterium sp. lm-10]|uniref:hypothetical protein n=1 Tax=Sphingobacterium sp. lm-10 TaxID=2944904 RepID=UPI00201FF8F2|nr:hypothetical protein [Sphingobacterium sp. lm-10]MCL7987120.1 hypothetical protein [Sphingobacterium sp. lm-10]